MPNQQMTFDEAVDLIEEITDVLSDLGLAEVIDVAKQLTQIAHMIEMGEWIGDSDSDTEQVVDLVIAGAATIQQALSEEPTAVAAAIDLGDQIATQFGDRMTQPTDTASDPWFNSSHQSPEEDQDEINAPTADEISHLLSQLATGDATEAQPSNPVAPPNRTATPAAKDSISEAAQNQTDTNQADTNQADVIHPELREAFLDDAKSCLGAMEQALLAHESEPSDKAPLQDLGRELHTMKGASASIGLTQLATYIHDVEDAINQIEASQEPAQPQQLFEFVDAIRAKIDAFRGKPQLPSPNTEAQSASTAATPNLNASDFDEGQTDDETVRIKASRLNRLMDMLSELVMLRNERDSELSNLMTINESLIDSVSRLRMANQGHDSSVAQRQDVAVILNDGTQIADIANDILESSHQLRECYQPVSDGNNAVSEFIRNFRHELVELRRTPISGLFLRLQRAVSDAARAEGKQVRLRLIGEQTGIERSLQTRVFEPLLHIVRNSVSHGIETTSERKNAGKSDFGTITLEAYSGPDLLVIEVRDDGSGLDYDAIRRRGLDRGLIAAGSSTSHEELAQLIFHPGFSTRETANQVSGRGVGMDVVASTLQRMRGWVEVESVTGQGTTIRLSLPLPSMIQHAMVFRSGGQLFAVPMQSIQSAGESDTHQNAIHVEQVLGQASPSRSSDPEMIVLRGGNAGAENDQAAAILVDEIVGPEEVVVRPMPKLFKQHPLCCGATLSGLGEVVLLLDAKQLASSLQQGSISGLQNTATPSCKKVLVADDSGTARLRVVQSLSRYAFEIVQARHGQEAWDLIQNNKFDAIFSDIDMPHMTGMELLQNVKQDSKHKSTPVVLISGRTDETIRHQACEFGSTACLAKPLADTALDNVLHQLSLFPNQSLTS